MNFIYNIWCINDLIYVLHRAKFWFPQSWRLQEYQPCVYLSLQVLWGITCLYLTKPNQIRIKSTFLKKKWFCCKNKSPNFVLLGTFKCDHPMRVMVTFSPTSIYFISFLCSYPCTPCTYVFVCVCVCVWSHQSLKLLLINYTALQYYYIQYRYSFKDNYVNK